MQPYKYLMGQVACSTHSKLQLLNELYVMLNGDLSTGNMILYVNPHIFNVAQQNSQLQQALRQARITSADGMGIVWCSSMFLDGSLAERCNMTEVFREFLADPRFPATKAVLVGGTEAEARLAASNMNVASQHCQVVDYVSGFLTDKDYQQYFTTQTDTDIILLGMGSPKSEYLAQMAATLCPKAVIWHIGGGTIMFYAGCLQEAPAWMRRSGLQWLHRLVLEPRRMWRRYLIGNITFLMSMCRLWWQRGLPWQSKVAERV
jgi:N-acetylglucosaminyldiphosphoundecaprenol N-acetyl-beta-D-mannosaminyltransferase